MFLADLPRGIECGCGKVYELCWSPYGVKDIPDIIQPLWAPGACQTPHTQRHVEVSKSTSKRIGMLTDIRINPDNFIIRIYPDIKISV